MFGSFGFLVGGPLPSLKMGRFSPEPKELLKPAGEVGPGSNWWKREARMAICPCPEVGRTILLIPGVRSKVFAAIEEDFVESIQVRRTIPEHPNVV